MKKILVIFLMFLATNFSYADSFEVSAEKFFADGFSSCMRAMTKYNDEDRKKFCECADKVTRDNIPDDQLRKLFSREIRFQELIEPVREKHKTCHEGLKLDQ